MSRFSKSFKIDFSQIPNQIINDNRVSLKAKGLYMFIVSKSDNYDLSLNGLVKTLKESRGAILRIMDELIELGYLDKIKNRVGNKVAVNDYILHIEPQIRSKSQNETHIMRLTLCDSQNETTTNTNSTNTKTTNKNSTLREKDFKSFKRDYINNYDGEKFFTIGLGWKADTAFILDESNYIKNTVSNKIITKEDSFKIWKHLFEQFKKGA